MTDNTIRVRADITDDPDAIHTDDGAQDDQNVVVPPPPAAGTAGQTTLAFKVEQSKIPEYFGQKGKDNITAIVFITEKSKIWPAPTAGLTPLHTQTWLTI